MTLLEAALWYAAQGFAVFPLHTPVEGGCSCNKADCSSVGKHPRTKDGLKNASKDPETILGWWTSWPDANIGLVTGAVSGIAVVDVDNDPDAGKYGAESLIEIDALCGGKLPETWLSLTGGGGEHYIFRCESPELPCRIGLLPGIDIRANGGYIVAPPSLHKSGRRYVWEASSDPADVPLAPMPLGLFGLITRGRQEEGREPTKVPERIGSGARNGTLFKIASSLRAKGFEEEELLAAVMAANERRCEPPLSEAEVRQICHSAGRYKAGDGLAKIQAAAAAADSSAKVLEAVPEDCDTATELLTEEVLAAIFAIPEEFDRQREIVRLRGIAKKKGYARDFDALLKPWKERVKKEEAAARALEPEEERTIKIRGVPLEGLVLTEGWKVNVFQGIYRYDENRVRESACPHPVIITDRLQNVDTGTAKLNIAFYRDNHWTALPVACSTVAGRTAIVQLSDRGLMVTSETARSLVTYLHDLEAANAERIPVRRSVGRMGWIGKEFSPYSPGYVFDGEDEERKVYEAVHSAGSLEEWLGMVGRARERSPIFRALLAASFCSPLLSKLGKQTFCAHMWGFTGHGRVSFLRMRLPWLISSRRITGPPVRSGSGRLHRKKRGTSYGTSEGCMITFSKC